MVIYAQRKKRIEPKTTTTLTSFGLTARVTKYQSSIVLLVSGVDNDQTRG